MTVTGPKTGKRRWRRWTPEEDAEGARLLRSGLSYGQVGQYLDRHPDLVGRRNREVWKVRFPESVWLDETFFDDWTPTMAYVLGFIMADGCLKRDSYWISISQKEPRILRKIAYAISHTGRLYRESRGYYKLEFRSEYVWKRLYGLGVTPAKSRTLELPDIPRQYLPHLIRGYFDGDGSVCVRDRGKKPLIYVSIATGSKRLKSQLCSALDAELGIHCSTSRYEVRILRHPEAKRFFLWLYADKDESLFLERKYARFVGVLEKRINWRKQSA